MKTCWDRFTTRDLRCASSSLAFARDHNFRWVRLSVLDRIPLLSQVVPVRKVRGKGPTAAKSRASAPAAASGKAGKSKEVAEAAAPDDLLPRTDISASITSNLADRFVRCANCDSICFFPRQYSIKALIGRSSPNLSASSVLAVPSGRSAMQLLKKWRAY